MMINSYVAAAMVTEYQREREQIAARDRLARLARPRRRVAAPQAGLTVPAIAAPTIAAVVVPATAAVVMPATAAVASRLAGPAGRASPEQLAACGCPA